MNKAIMLWIALFAAFPPLDPASEFHDQGVESADVVEWIGEHAQEIHDAIDAATDADGILSRGSIYVERLKGMNEVWTRELYAYVRYLEKMLAPSCTSRPIDGHRGGTSGK